MYGFQPSRKDVRVEPGRPVPTLGIGCAPPNAGQSGGAQQTLAEIVLLRTEASDGAPQQRPTLVAIESGLNAGEDLAGLLVLSSHHDVEHRWIDRRVNPAVVRPATRAFMAPVAAQSDGHNPTRCPRIGAGSQGKLGLDGDRDYRHATRLPSLGRERLRDVSVEPFLPFPRCERARTGSLAQPEYLVSRV